MTSMPPFRAFRRLFPAPDFPGNPEKTRLATLVSDFFGVAILVAAANLAVTVPTGQFVSWINVAMTCIALVGSIFALSLLRRGHVTAVAVLGMLLLFAIGAIGLIKVNTVHGLQMLALLTSAIFTTMVLGPRPGLAVMAAAILLVLGYTAVQAQGGLGPSRTPGPWSQWILFVTHGLLLFLLATLLRQHMLQAVGEEKTLGDRVRRLLDEVSAARAEAEMSAARYRTLFENMSECLVVVQDAAITFANPSLARMLKMPLESLHGKPFSPWVHADDIDRVIARQAERIRGKGDVTHDRFRIVDARGGIVWVELSSVTIPWNGRPATLSFMLDISARVALEDDLQRSLREATRAREQAEAASRTKSVFLANMSHEIRTPMNSVLGMAHLLQRTTLDDRQRDYADKIQISGEHLLGIIEDILDYSKIEAGKVVLETVPFSVGDVTDRLGAIIGPRAAAKQLALSVTVADDVPPVLYGDPLRLEQVLLNFLGNAVKFTEQGSIGLRIGCLSRGEQATMLRIDVSDTGIGIAEGELATLFQPFAQADASTTRRFGGSGLGLSIARRLVALMGGEMGVHSTPGVGSTFWFTVPFRENPVASGDDPPPRRHAAWTDPQDPSRLRGCRILLAEDNPFNQQVAVELLEGAGATVVAAGNGREALERLRDDRFDCVLMDVQMPVMDGLEATRAIRALATGGDIRVIAMTANASARDRQQCLDAGMDDFLTKPIIPEHLVRTILSWVDPRPASAPATATPASSGTDEDGPANDDALFSGAALDKLGQGDPDLVQRLAQSFLKNLRELHNELTRATATDDLRQLGLTAHRLKSAARWVGARRLGRHCQTLETLAQEGKRDEALRCLAELTPMLLEVEALSEAKLDTFHAPASP